jgi:hypothetical protein
MKMKILKLTDKVFQYYKENVKENENITRDQAAKKLTRNKELAMRVPPRNNRERQKGYQMYYYGNLHFVVSDDKVIHIKNHADGNLHCAGWFLDENRYAELTNKLGIED